jgi:hypothetical protein
LAHGYKEGLTPRGRWPGVPWIKDGTEGAVLKGIWIDRTGYYHAKYARKRRKGEKGPKVKLKDYKKKKTLKLATVPGWEGLTIAETRTRWTALVEAAHIKHTPTRTSPMGVQKVLDTKPHKRPERISRSPAPLVHTRAADARRAWKKNYRTRSRTHASRQQRRR